MNRKKILLYTLSALCVLWVILMAAAAINIYSEGAAYQAQGHPEAWIYTREKAAAAITRYLPLLLLSVALNIVAVITGVRDEEQDKPVHDPDLMRLYKEECESASDAGNKAPDAGTIRNVKIAVFVIAIVFIAAGIFNGSMEDMLIKAVNICTECVGLG